jgi:hypothetical protein
MSDKIELTEEQANLLYSMAETYSRKGFIVDLRNRDIIKNIKGYEILTVEMGALLNLCYNAIQYQKGIIKQLEEKE